jgi:hypothetical protein
LKVSDLPAPIPPLVPDVATLRSQIAAKKGLGQDAPDDSAPDASEENRQAKEDELDKEMIYMGIVTSDSTVVYYKLTKGIKKPADIPDE